MSIYVKMSAAEALQGWFEVVDKHNLLKLSNPSDRLPSLAGIARAYHRHHVKIPSWSLGVSFATESLVAFDGGSDSVDDYGIGQASSWSWVLFAFSDTRWATYELMLLN